MRNDSLSPVAVRAPKEWFVRGMLAILIAATGYIGVSYTLANVVVKLDPMSARAMAPLDGRLTAELAEQQFTLNPGSKADSDPARLAGLALLQDPTAIKALTVLGLQAQMRNDPEQARRLFAHSLAMSRRSLRARIWAIEEAVGRGDIKDAVQNYDIALRSSKKAPALLLPILASAIAEPKIRSAIIKTLAEKPLWGEYFINYLASDGPDPQATVRFYREGFDAGLPVDDADRASLVDALIVRDLFDEAWTYYTTFRSGTNRRRSRDPIFSESPDVPSRFDWIATNADGLSASIQRDENGGIVNFSSPPSVGGVLLEQTQMLTPGAYRLEGYGSGIEQPERSLLYWKLTCHNEKEVVRVNMPNSNQASGRFSGHFLIPIDCPVQTLSLMTRPSDQIVGVTGQIHQVRIVPIGQTQGE